MKELNELRITIEKLSIQVAMNLSHLKTLQDGLMELSHHVLSDSESRNFAEGYFHTLYDETARRMNQMIDASNLASVQMELLDLKSYVSQKLEQLNEED